MVYAGFCWSVLVSLRCCGSVRFCVGFNLSRCVFATQAALTVAVPFYGNPFSTGIIVHGKICGCVDCDAVRYTSLEQGWGA